MRVVADQEVLGIRRKCCGKNIIPIGIYPPEQRREASRLHDGKYDSIVYPT
jgi:hypothetical protein